MGTSGSRLTFAHRRLACVGAGAVATPSTSIGGSQGTIERGVNSETAARRCVVGAAERADDDDDEDAVGVGSGMASQTFALRSVTVERDIEEEGRRGGRGRGDSGNCKQNS